jgi:hypothetical protein
MEAFFTFFGPITDQVSKTADVDALQIIEAAQ